MSNLKTFIGVSMIQAEPMLKYDAYMKGLIKDHAMVKDGSDHADEGYHVVYPDGYHSWSPSVTFEKKHFEIAEKDKISPSDITRFHVKGKGIKLGEKTCVVLDSTITGFDMIGTSACVDPRNYNQEIGDDIARKDIVDNLWGHMGFILQWARFGIK